MYELSCVMHVSFSVSRRIKKIHILGNFEKNKSPKYDNELQ